MRRKLAVTAAAVVATMVAFSPLAFAGSSGETDDDGDSYVQDVGNTQGDQTGLVNLDDVNVLNNSNICPGVNPALGNVLGILGSGNAQSKDNDTKCD